MCPREGHTVFAFFSCLCKYSVLNLNGNDMQVFCVLWINKNAKIHNLVNVVYVSLRNSCLQIQKGLLRWLVQSSHSQLYNTSAKMVLHRPMFVQSDDIVLPLFVAPTKGNRTERHRGYSENA